MCLVTTSDAFLQVYKVIMVNKPRIRRVSKLEKTFEGLRRCMISALLCVTLDGQILISMGFCGGCY